MERAPFAAHRISEFRICDLRLVICEITTQQSEIANFFPAQAFLKKQGYYGANQSRRNHQTDPRAD
jgi:hypothetical protein